MAHARSISTNAPTPAAVAAVRAASGGYDISKPAGRCAVSGRTVEPGERFMTALRDTPQGFQRLDVAGENWDAFDKADLLGYWQTTMPRPEEKPKKLLVDDPVLLELFERLEGNDDPSRQNFRFVLGLILMRKRLLAYESTVRTDSGTEVWLMRVRGREQPLNLVNPHLGEEQVADVSRQLGEVLAEA